jgi:hypothetical protein
VRAFQYRIAYLWLFAAAASLVFWLPESIWKRFQYLYAPRIEEIEKIFRKEDFSNVHPLQIGTSWFKAFEKQGWNISSTFRMGIVMFPHVLTLLAGTALFSLHLAGVIKLAAATK